MSREDPQLKIRLPQELKHSIEASAAESGRTMNAEVVARLRASFDSGIPSHVRDQIDGFAAERKITFEEALEQMVFAATATTAQVLVIRPAPGMTIEEMRRMFDVAREKADPFSSVISWGSEKR